jgi:hypothetical protein
LASAVLQLLYCVHMSLLIAAAEELLLTIAPWPVLHQLRQTASTAMQHSCDALILLLLLLLLLALHSCTV